MKLTSETPKQYDEADQFLLGWVQLRADAIAAKDAAESALAAVLVAMGGSGPSSGPALVMVNQSYAGDGTRTSFALPHATQNVIVWLGGVRQVPGDDYNITGSTLTFVDAPETFTPVDVTLLT